MHETTTSTEQAPNYAQHALLWESSGLTQATYCQRHGLELGPLTQARAKLLLSRNRERRASEPPRFLPVRPKSAVPEKAPGHPGPIIIRFSKGAVIELPSNLEPELFKILFKTLS